MNKSNKHTGPTEAMKSALDVLASGASYRETCKRAGVSLSGLQKAAEKAGIDTSNRRKMKE